MPQKRKRISSTTTSKKRQKPDEYWDLDDPEVYEVDEILQESGSQYLISWAPNATTGETFSPGWYPKTFVNEAAVADWERKRGPIHHSPPQPVKRGRGRPRKSQPGTAFTPTVPTSSAAHHTPLSSPPTPKRGRGRPRKSLTTATSGTPIAQSSGAAHPTPQSSPPVKRPRGRPRKIVESSPSQSTELEASSPAAVVPSSFEASYHTPQRTHSPPLERSSHAQVVVEVPSARSSQPEPLHVNSSPIFHSSQIIAGTAPERDQRASLEDLPRQFADAAASPDLEQKHSQYDSGSEAEARESLEHNTASAEPTSSSDLLYNSQVAHQRTDTESVLDSQQAYVPSTQQESRPSQIASTQSNIVVEFAEPTEDISEWSAHIQPQPRSRFISRPKEALQIAPFRQLQYQDVTHISETLQSQLGSQIVTLPTAHSVICVSSGENPVATSEDETESEDPQSQFVIDEDFIQQEVPSVADHEHDPEEQPTRPSPEHQTSDPQLVKSPQASERDRIRANQESEELSTKFCTQITPQGHTALDTNSRDISLSLLGALQRTRETINHQFEQIRPSIEGTIESLLELGNLPQPPSQWPETFHSAPARPVTPSDLPSTPSRIMSSTSPQSGKVEVSQRMQELLETGHPITPAQRVLGMTTRSSANRAASPAAMRDDRSPSAVPHIESIPMPNEDDDHTSERYLTLIPENPQEAKLTQRSLPAGITEDDALSQNEAVASADEDMLVERDPVEEPTNEHAVPVFFLGHQRDSYKQSIVWSRKFLEEFLSRSWPDGSPMFDTAQALVEKLQQVTSHPDLMNEESFTQAQVEPKVKAQWDRDTSAKFRFISLLLAEFEDQKMHVVLDIQSGRLLDVMQTFLAGLGIRHSRAYEAESLTTQTGLHVTLLPKNTSSQGLARADLVIGFEGALELIEDQRRALRKDAGGTIAPLIYLVVPKTVEHIERCLLSQQRHNGISINRRNTILVENAALLRNEAGYRQIHDQESSNSAASIAAFIIAGDQKDEWPVDELTEIAIKDSTSESQATTASGSTVPPSSTQASSNKRQLEETGDEPSEHDPKKVRINIHIPESSEPISTIDPSSLLLSNSVDRQAVAVSEYVSDMETLKHEYELREIELRGEIAIHEARLSEHVAALEALQYRFEDQRAELIKTISERDEAFESATRAMAQMSSRDTLVSKLKLERDEYKTLLAEAKLALAAHAVPEVAEVERLKSQILAAEKEKSKLEGRVKSLGSDTEYVRGLYQEASTMAASLAEEKSELDQRVQELEKRSSAATAEAIRQSQGNAQKRLHNEVKLLKATLAERERTLKAKDEEMQKLREKERGRMGTRGSSVPRSPGRLGSPMRLEPPRGSSRNASPMRSSPAPGTLGLSVKSRLGR